MVNDDDPTWRSPVDATFTEVVEGVLLAGEETWEGVPGLQEGGTMRMRIEFHDEGPGRTRIVITQGPYTAQMQDLAGKGWASSFSKLDKLLAQ
jgi:hypothetical protein